MLPHVHGCKLIYRPDTAISKTHAGVMDFNVGTSKPTLNYTVQSQYIQLNIDTMITY